MKNLRELFTHERAARPLLLAHVQSSLGSGAAYVALLLIAYERFHSALAVSAVLLCEFVPMLLLGAVMGAAADRWSRRTILIGADVLRAAAFMVSRWSTRSPPPSRWPRWPASDRPPSTRR